MTEGLLGQLLSVPLLESNETEMLSQQTSPFGTTIPLIKELHGTDLYIRLVTLVFCVQCWRRQWLVLDIVETVDQSPALIARIYASHHHEDRSLPLSTVTLPDVHALHRAQSRSVNLSEVHITSSRGRKTRP